ncbi:MAG: hypothetical protein J6Y53_00415 [Alphaproteobacteria bacterium]|nr:hypothetical protein [Alphaproteobacteria bacterium]
MIRGLVNVFRSGLIIHPMVLLGIGVAAYLCLNYKIPEIFAFLALPQLYFGVLAVAFVYTIVFNRAQKGYSDIVDWKGTFGHFIGNIFKLLLSCACALSLFMMFLF